MTAEDHVHRSSRGQGLLTRPEHGRVLAVVEDQVAKNDHIKLPPLTQTAEQRRHIRAPQIALIAKEEE